MTTLVMTDLIGILEADKSLSAITGWRPVNQKNELSAGIEIDAVIQQGVSFRANCRPHLPDESVSLLLLAEIKGKPRPFARVDWRGSEHNNHNRALCAAYWGQAAGRTHFHDPRDHLHIEMAVLFGGGEDLPIARAIAPEPQNFHDLLATSATLLNINNLTKLPAPPWPRTPSFLS